MAKSFAELLENPEDYSDPVPIELYEYSDGIGEKLIDLMSKKNLTWSELAKYPGMPSLLQLHKWYKESPKFKELMDLSDRVRAREEFESIVKTSDSTRDLTSKEEIAAEKLWFDKKKYIMEKSDPERFGNQQGKETGGTQINIVLPIDYNKEVDISDIVDVSEITHVEKKDVGSL